MFTFATPALAAPTAVDDIVAVPSNTTVFANDLAANDTVLPTDVYTVTSPPSHGTATLTPQGLLDYTPNIGFASTDTFTYSVDDGVGGVATATVTLHVVLTSDFLTPATNFIIGQEDVPSPLNLTVDPSLEFGGTLQDIIGVDALYRSESQTGVPISSTIPTGTTGIKITGYATRNVDTTYTDDHNDDYELLSINVDLRNGTYSGRLTYSIEPNEGLNLIDQYTWLDVPLGQSVLSDTNYVSGNWTGDADPLVSLVSGQIQITETIPLQIAYHVEYMTSDGDSADFVSGSGDVQGPGDTQSNFDIPAELEPSDGSQHGFLVVTGNSASNGSHYAEEHKGFSRMVINLESRTVSGVVASERGELDSLVTTWSFLNYPLIDLRDTPAATPVSITSSTATTIGDSSASATQVEDDPTIYIDASGDLIVERASDHSNVWTTMYTIENYLRTGLSSIASFVGVESDTSLFDSTPPDGVDANGKPVNLQTFEIPASSSIGIVQMSWQTIGGGATNENVGYGFAVIDLTNNTSAGSITFSRATTPDLVAWQGVPLGTTMYGATDGGVPLYQSNKNPGAFTDDYAETARFTIVNNPDGSRTLEFTATSNAGTGTFADYLGTTQVSWLGSEPFRVEGVPASGTLSHGSPTASGGWEVEPGDIPLLTISTDEHATGELELNLILTSTGETDTIVVHVQPVVDDPILTANDVIGYAGNPVPMGISVGDSADVDGSETQLQTLTLSGIPASVTLSASAGTISNFGGGNWKVDRASLLTLSAIGPITNTTVITVSGTNTDTADLDGDMVIEDGNNGSGVDELSRAVYQETFNLTIREVPTVTSQTTNTGTPVISGTATFGIDESLTVTVNGVTYSDGDGNLVDNGDGTWDLTIPAANTIADGTYEVVVSLNHVSGASGSDTTTGELIIDATPPVVPTANVLVTSDATPITTGTANVGPGEVLLVNVDGITYSHGDSNLIDHGNGTWTLSISTPLAEGVYDVTVSVSDAAGNTSIDTTAGELTIEATPLSTPTVVALTTSDTTPTITGNAVVGSANTLTVAVNGVTYTAGDGNLSHSAGGTWTLNIPTPLADNTYEVIATVTDVFGNAYPDTSSDELVVDTTAPVAPTVVSQTTSNTSPTISGNAVVGAGESLTVTVGGVTYTEGDGNLTNNGDGTWDLLVPVVLSAATYSVTATVTDSVGNFTHDTTANELVIDTTPPVIPTVEFQTTSDNTPTISGTATVGAGETLTVSVAGVTYTAGQGLLVVNGDGTWDLPIPTSLADGVYNVNATVIDAAGNSSTDNTALELTIDTEPPVTPTVQSQNTNSTSPTIVGTATVTSGDVLSVTVAGTTYTAGDGLLTDNGDGTWALSIPVTLAQGTYNVTTTVTDPAGNATSDTTASELIIDLTAPIAPGVTSQATTDATPAIKGTAILSPGEILTVEVNGIVYTAGNGDLVDKGDGTWVLTIPATNILSENLYQVVATVTDAAGNFSIDPGIDDLVVDFTAPITPGVTSQTTNNTLPVIEGTAIVAANETLTVNVNGVTYTAGDGNLVDNADGTWTLSVPTPIVEGLYNVTAVITDLAANTSTDPSSSELLIDTTPPLTPTVVPQFTSDTTPVIEGTANPGPGETLTVTVDGVTYTIGDGNLLDNGDGTWELTIPAPLLEGTYEVTTTVTDAAGNESTDTTANELVIDVTDPVVPTVNTLVTNTSIPTLTGSTTLLPGETLSITVNGVTYIEGDGNLVDNGDATWSLLIPAANALADGSYEVVATLVDLSGNTSTDTTSLELTIDTVSPVIPTVVAQTTSNPTPTITGNATVAAGELLTVSIDGVTYTAGDGYLVDNGDGTWALSLPVGLSDNTYPVTVTILDIAGNSSVDATTAELTIDTVAPVVPTVTSLNTNDTTPTITGTATVTASENLTVTLDGFTYTTSGGFLTDNGNGTWVLNVPAIMADGNYEVIATVSDAAGNSTADVSALELTIDTVAPIIPTVTALTTNDTTPELTGSATVGPGETLTVTVGGFTYTAGDGFLVVDTFGTWLLSVPTALAQGTYEVTSTVTDAAGNSSTDGSANELIIDTTPPTTPTVVSQITNSPSPTINGTATVGPDETLTVTVDGTTYTAGDGFLVDNGDGSWTLSVPVSLAENTFDITATVTDTAGNATSDTTSAELIVDLTAPIAPGVTSLVTNESAPVIEGTATLTLADTLTVEVNSVVYTQGDGFLVDNGDGTWTLTIPAANSLAENLYQVLATVTDTAGNSAIDPGVDDLLVDFTAPPAPGVTSQTTNNTTPTIEGTATLVAGDTLSVTVNGVTYTAGDGSLTDNGDDTWALAMPVPLAEGSYDVTAIITDLAGNLSLDPSSTELLIDTTEPIAPTVTPLTTNNTTPTLTGTAAAGPGETLSIEVNGVIYTAGDGNLTDNGDGTWALAIPTALAEGTYEVVTTITDAAGNTSIDNSSNELIIDVTDPVIPTVIAQISSSGTPVVSGTTSTVAGETLSVSVDGVTYNAGDGNLVVNGDGTWDLTIPAANTIADGNYEVIATITDLAGNTSVDTSSLELIIDTVAPIVPTVTSQHTSNATPTISGSATVATGEILTVELNGTTYAAGDGNLVDNGDGTWDLTVPTALFDNTYGVTATVTDAAGNFSVDTTTAELIVDTVPPVIPTVTALNTSDITPTLQGTATVAPGETLTVTVNGVTYTAGDGNLVNNGDGTWDLVIPVALAESTYEVISTVTDSAGNSSNDSSFTELVVDITPPVTPTVISQNTNNTTPVILGTATVGAGETLAVTVDGMTYVAGEGNLVDNGDGTWALSIPSALAEATYPVTATVTDAAGNMSIDTSTNELVIDITTPIVPTVNPLITSIDTPVLSGSTTTTAGETLRITVDGETYVAGDGNLVDNGDGTWNLTIPAVNAIADGLYEVIATITDLAGNTSTDVSIDELFVDTTPPATPTVVSLITNNASPSITGTATVAPDETLTVTVDGSVYNAGDGFLVNNGDGTWTLSIPISLAEGVYSVFASVTDLAGNATFDTTSDELTIDLTAPIAPGVTSLVTNNPAPTIEGTATLTAADTLTVEVNTVIYTAGDGFLVDNADGTWTLSIPVVNSLVENLYQVVATVTDTAGNSAIDPGTDDLLVDFTAPPAPGVTSQTTNNTTPVIEGTATLIAGDTLSVTVNGVTYTAGDGNLTDNGDGTWALAMPVALTEGSYNITATITDLAGNLSSDPSSGELLIDTTLPTTPAVTPLNTSNTSPVLVGTANAGPGETLSVEVNGVTFTAGDGNLTDNGDGTWTLALPTALAEGTYEVIATVTDAAGNTSIDTGLNELIIDITDPVVPTVDLLISDISTPTLTGTTSTVAGETLSVSVDGVSYAAGNGNLVVNGDGTWDLTITTANSIADGTYEVIATITDIAGNTSIDTSALELTVDTVAPVIPTVTTQNTSNSTPTISGNATLAASELLTVEVNGVTYTAGDGNLVDNGDGTWDLNVPTALNDNTYAVTVTVTDAAGNSSVDTTTAELIIDTVAPAIPTVTSLITSNTSPSIQGSAAVATGEQLTVTVNAVTYIAGAGDLILNGDGTWTLFIPVPLVDNTYEVISTVTDSAGNAANDVTFAELVIDTTAPIIPTVVSQNTSDQTPVLTGTAVLQPGETLTVTVGGTTYTAGDGSLMDVGDGTWQLLISVPLPEGTYDVIATVTDIAGNLSTDASNEELVIDLTDPVIPTVNALISNSSTPILSGTTSNLAGETLSVFVNGVVYTTGDGNLVVDGSGAWELTIPVANSIADGNYEVMATIIDLAGNMSVDTSAFELTVDTLVPAVPSVVAQNTSDTTPTIIGNAVLATSEFLTVEINGVTYTAGDGNLVDNGDGTWALNVPTALLDNTYEITVTITDAAGNTSVDTTSNELIVDTVDPAIPTVTALNTSDNTPIIEGTASVAPGETLTVTVDGTTYTAGDGNLVDNGDGTWTLTIPSPLADATYDVMSTITDGAGNTSSDVTQAELLVDTVSPAVPTVVSQNTNTNTPLIEGTAVIAAGETLTVTVAGTTYTAGDGHLTDNGDGTWTLNVPTPIPEGIYDVTATVTDVTGNSSTDTSASELVIDTTGPGVPIVFAQNTNNASPTIIGTAVVGAGETLTVTVDGTTYTAGDGHLIDNGDGTWTLSLPVALIEGSYDVTATVTDAAGNTTSDSNSSELVIDLTAPIAPGVTNLATNLATPVIEGTATMVTGEVLTVEVNGILYTEGDGNLVDNGNNTWSLTIPATDALIESVYQVVATVTDIAGNLSLDPGIDDLLVDFTAPNTPGVTSQTTNDHTPLIEGTAMLATGEFLTVAVNGVTYTAGDGYLVDNGNGTWSLSVPVPVAEGIYDVTATITDASGNVSTDPGSSELLVDTTPPNTPTVTPLTTNDTTPVIQGTANAGPGETLTVTVDEVTYSVGDGNLVDNGDGTWSLTLPTPLAEGNYNITASVSDAAGNSVSDGSVDELTIDTTAPAVPSATPQNTNNTNPVVTGTANVGPGETLTVTIDGTTYTAGDGHLIDNGDGTWELLLPTALTDGSYSITVSISDSAGNTTSNDINTELVIQTIPPLVPTVTPQTTNDTTPTLFGTATLAPGEVLTVVVNGVTYTMGDGNLIVNGDGTWVLNLPTALTPGVYDIVATVSDIYGNSSVSETAQLAIVAQSDFDGDGIPDSLDLDDDNDGIPDSTEGTLDSDNDGQPDYQDLDSDNDGIADIIEVGGDDSNNDYRVDNFLDNNNDGLSDELQLFPFELIDSDADRIADFRDLDSDNDGLTDLFESGGLDDDNDGRIDGFIDLNKDGVDDANQLTSAAGRDTDGDGIPNRLDLDTDNDGLFDVVEAGASDIDNDGLIDTMKDQDRDGIADSVDVDVTLGADSNGDGVDDRFGITILNSVDTDGDGIADEFDPDANGDGFADGLTNNLVLGQALPDIDGNGQADLFEANGRSEVNEFVETGLRGYGGCSVVSRGNAKKSVDPLFLLMLIISISFLYRRPRLQRRPLN